LNVLNEKRDEFIMLTVELYHSAKGELSESMYTYCWNAPDESSNPVKHLIYLIRLYKSDKGSFYGLIVKLLDFLNIIADTLSMYDQIDENPYQPKGVSSGKQHMDEFVRSSPEFAQFFRVYVEPFLNTMENLKDKYIQIKQDHPHNAHEIYKFEYGHKHLNHIRNFLLETAQFIRHLRAPTYEGSHGLKYRASFVQKVESLYRNVAFGIEVMIGVYAPLTHLLEEVTPLMIPYMSTKRKSESSLDTHLLFKRHTF